MIMPEYFAALQLPELGKHRRQAWASKLVCVGLLMMPLQTHNFQPMYAPLGQVYLLLSSSHSCTQSARCKNPPVSNVYDLPWRTFRNSMSNGAGVLRQSMQANNGELELTSDAHLIPSNAPPHAGSSGNIRGNERADAMRKALERRGKTQKRTEPRARGW